MTDLESPSLASGGTLVSDGSHEGLAAAAALMNESADVTVITVTRS
jgi:hypothetical protein